MNRPSELALASTQSNPGGYQHSWDSTRVSGSGSKPETRSAGTEAKHGILDGDYIFVKKRDSADAGDIVVVIIEYEATVKRYYPEGDRVRLQPANARMQPIYVHKRDFKDIQIIGIVVGVYRKL